MAAKQAAFLDVKKHDLEGHRQEAIAPYAVATGRKVADVESVLRAPYGDKPGEWPPGYDPDTAIRKFVGLTPDGTGLDMERADNKALPLPKIYDVRELARADEPDENDISGTILGKIAAANKFSAA